MLGAPKWGARFLGAVNIIRPNSRLGGIDVTVLSWPIGRTARVGRIGRAGKTIIQIITDSVGYWRRYKNILHALSSIPECVLADYGICRQQIPAIAAYAAVAQVDIAVAIDHFARLPPAPLSVLHVR